MCATTTAPHGRGLWRKRTDPSSLRSSDEETNQRAAANDDRAQDERLAHRPLLDAARVSCFAGGAAMAATVSGYGEGSRSSSARPIRFSPRSTARNTTNCGCLRSIRAMVFMRTIVAGILRFRARGGGLMITRDHMDLGCSVCGSARSVPPMFSHPQHRRSCACAG